MEIVVADSPIQAAALAALSERKVGAIVTDGTTLRGRKLKNGVSLAPVLREPLTFNDLPPMAFSSVDFG